MAIIRHTPDGIAMPIGGYSAASEVGPGSRLLFISGQIARQNDGEVPDGFRAQCEAVWDNLETILRAAKMDVGDLVKVTTFLTHPDQVEMNREIRQRRLGGSAPALTVIVVQTLDSRWLLEIEAVAARAD